MNVPPRKKDIKSIPNQLVDVPVGYPFQNSMKRISVTPPATTVSDYEVHFRWRFKCYVPTCIKLLVAGIFVAIISHNQYEIMTLKNQVQLLEDVVNECISEICNGNRNIHEQQIIHKGHMKSGNEQVPSFKRRAKRVANQDSNRTLAVHLLNHKTIGEIGRKVEIRDWYASEFVPGGEEYFLLDQTGRSIRIKVPGLYWIYSQVLYYIDLETEGGYEICLDWKKDNESCRSLARCVFTSGRGDAADATCFTGTAARLKAGDVIYIRLLQLGRQINFTSGNCFFGLIRIGD